MDGASLDSSTKVYFFPPALRQIFPPSDMFLSLSSSRAVKTFTYPFRMLFFREKKQQALCCAAAAGEECHKHYLINPFPQHIEHLHGLNSFSRTARTHHLKSIMAEPFFAEMKQISRSISGRKLIKLNLYFFFSFTFPLLAANFVSFCRMLQSSPRLTSFIPQTLFGYFFSHPAPHV